MTAVAATPTLSAKLKDGTWDLHAQAEKQTFQQNLVKGKITREAYAGWLAQMLLIHTALERRLRDLCEQDPRVAAVVTDEQQQEPYLLADLAALGYDKPAEPLPSTGKLTESIDAAAKTEPLRLLGYHYVLEGSNNGNSFIARAVRPALGLEPGSGDRYLDPYGERQRAVWASFKEAIDGQEFSTAEQDAMIEAAREMFASISELSAELPSDA